MITRLVKMHFKESETAQFLEYFKTIKHQIEAMPGLVSLSLFSDLHNPNQVFTYSVWQSEDDLNAYRNSELFGEVWPNTKKRFQERAEAWSLTLN